MRPKRYVDELTIRWIYVNIGRRIGYIQRKIYEYGREEEFSEIYGGENGVYQEEIRLLKGRSDRSRGFTRERGRRRRRISNRRYRTRCPGIFQQENRKRRSSRLRTNRGIHRRRVNWYTSDVDVRRSDRRRNIGIYILRIRIVWIYIKKNALEINRIGEKRREIRGRRLWLGIRIWVWRSDSRFDRSTIRSRTRSIRSYRRSIERRRRVIYRRKGRKWK